MTGRHDRGLHAVRRVRSVRENDSRIGLQRALAERQAKAEAADRADEALRVAPPFTTGAVGDFVAHARGLDALATSARASRSAAESSARVADEATRRWQHDRTEVRVAELLLERRAAERAAEQERRTAAELDDLASAGWLRRATAAAATEAADERDADMHREEVR
jgi:hypothetical protein